MFAKKFLLVIRFCFYMDGKSNLYDKLWRRYIFSTVETLFPRHLYAISVVRAHVCIRMCMFSNVCVCVLFTSFITESLWRAYIKKTLRRIKPWKSTPQIHDVCTQELVFLVSSLLRSNFCFVCCSLSLSLSIYLSISLSLSLALSLSCFTSVVQNILRSELWTCSNIYCVHPNLNTLGRR